MDKQLKIAKILALIFIVTVVGEASLFYVFNPYIGIKCPSCNSTNTKLWATDEYEPEYECQNCGALFFQSGYIWGYNEKINVEYNKTKNQTNNTAD